MLCTLNSENFRSFCTIYISNVPQFFEQAVRCVWRVASLVTVVAGRNNNLEATNAFSEVARKTRTKIDEFLSNKFQ